MGTAEGLDRLHFSARRYIWLRYFAVFCRIALAAGFIPSGLQKIIGERFTVLAVNHPMGNFLEAFHATGFYYTFVGLMQVSAAVLLLVPRTATLGAVIYFPIILNICVLSLAVRFDGSQITSPLMVCAVLYLLCWDYHKLKSILPFSHSESDLPRGDELTRNFPAKFFAGVIAVIFLVVIHTSVVYEILPRNTFNDCISQCSGMADMACVGFCECIHKEGNSLRQCLEAFKVASY